MIDLKGNPFYLTEEQVKWVEKAKEKLTLEQKAGQLFCVMGGNFTLEELCRMITEQGVGAVLYRPAPAEEIREKYAVLDKAVSGMDMPIPLLKAANLEEGGYGAISDGTLFGWPMTVGAADDPEIVKHFAQVSAVEGRSIGVNWTFSPVSDLSINFLNPITNVRSFGSDQEKVMEYTRLFSETVQDCGVAACAKHYPGDGVDFRDQHLHPTYNSLSAEEWYASYGKVYQNLIEGGLLSVMVGHIVQPNVARKKNPQLTFEDCLPASLSREMLQGVLREEFGFNGVITTDATIMNGYCQSMPRREALPATIMAGCDMFVFNTDFQEDYRYVMEALADGRITRERLEEAVTRILALKVKMAPENLNEAPEIDALQWQRECAKKSVTLVKNRQDILPIAPETYPRIRLISLGKDEVVSGIAGKGTAEKFSIKEFAKEYLEGKGFEVELYDPFRDNLHGTKDLPQDRLTLWLSNYEQASNQTTVRINWCRKHALDAPRFVHEEPGVFISFGNPYLLMDVPRVKTYINAYTATKPIVEAALEKLIGEGTFEGVSPVDAFCGLLDTRI